MPIPHSNRGRVGMGFSPARDGTLQRLRRAVIRKHGWQPALSGFNLTRTLHGPIR
jgi:hypothetical protein